MKRSIRFRVWGRLGKEWDEASNDWSFAMLSGDQFAFEEYRPINDLLATDGYIFMQSTGLTDAQGKEIYEDDIVATSPPGVIPVHRDLQGNPKPSKPIYGSVVWEESKARFSVKWGYGTSLSRWWMFQDPVPLAKVAARVYVCGNIHVGDLARQVGEPFKKKNRKNTSGSIEHRT